MLSPRDSPTTAIQYESLEELKQEFDKRGIKIGQYVFVDDPVFIGDGVQIADDARIEYAASLGLNCQIGLCATVGARSCVGAHSIVDNAVTVPEDYLVKSQTRLRKTPQE